jgi:hypothetical protein
MIAWGRALQNMMCFRDTESGLVRMFRTEYSKEYQHLRKQGTDIDDSFVRTFLELKKQS